MAVYARGYRPYEGSFKSAPVAFSIFSEGIRMALARKGVRRISIMVALIFCVYAGILYFQFALAEQSSRVPGPLGSTLKELFQLNDRFREFHVHAASLLAMIATVLVGSGLIADDLRTRALALYLVRPLRPRDYMLGKAMIIPALLVPFMLLPGLLLWLLVGLWQPPGETWTWLGDHIHVAQRVVKYYILGSISLTGLMLVLSSRTPRRGLVMGLAAVVLFGGMFPRFVGMRIAGPLGDLLRVLDVPNNITMEFKMAAPRRWEQRVLDRHDAGIHPDATAVWIVSLLLLAAGLYFTWRRARTVEVGE